MMGRKILHVENHLLVALFRLDGKRVISASGMPADARIVRATGNFDRDRTSFLVESAEFAELKFAGVYEHMRVEFAEHDPPTFIAGT